MYLKKIRNFLLFGLGVLLLNSCAIKEKTVMDGTETFKSGKATYQKWVAGVAGGGAGYTLYFEANEGFANKNITLDTVYFRDWKAPLETSKKNTFTAIINDGTNNEIQGAMSVGKESERVDWDKLPVKIPQEEALILFVENGKQKYLRVQLVNTSAEQLPR